MQNADATVLGLYPSTFARLHPLNLYRQSGSRCWEIYYARWDVFMMHGHSTRWIEQIDSKMHQDGMTNWEEYNSISTISNEIANNRSAPKYFVTTLVRICLQEWAGIQTDLSFGDFLTEGSTTLPVRPQILTSIRWRWDFRWNGGIVHRMESKCSNLDIESFSCR